LFLAITGNSDTAVTHEGGTSDRDLVQSQPEAQAQRSLVKAVLESPVSQSKKKTVRKKPVCASNVSKRSATAERASRESGIAMRGFIAKLNHAS
jgi:hypothetical protein